MTYPNLLKTAAIGHFGAILLCSSVFGMGKPTPQAPKEPTCQDILNASENPDTDLARSIQFNNEDVLRCKLSETEAKQKEQEAIKQIDDQTRQDAQKSLQDYENWASKFLLGWQQSRCETFGDNVAQGSDAVGRTAWAKKCTQAKIDLLSKKTDATSIAKFQRLNFEMMMLNNWSNAVGPLGRVYYPTYGMPDYKNGSNPSNPLKYQAPTSATASCDYDELGRWIGIPENYVLVAFCTAGCFTADQQLLYVDGYHPIGEGFAASLKSIVALSSDSTLEAPKMQGALIQSYTLDLVEGWHDMIELKTISGKSLNITANHPLLLSTGEMVQADALQTGNLLVNTDGTAELITEITARNYFGKVYNVSLQSRNLQENIIVAQGLLSGTAFYQNEGVKYLNRSLFRMNLKDPLAQQQ